MFPRAPAAPNQENHLTHTPGDAEPPRTPGGVQYQAVDDGYFAARTLRRHARAGSLWALGVGAVISGDFFGWNFGLAHGGFGGLLVATVIATAMYAGLCCSIAEMTCALPHAGGAYSFARSAMGPWGGYVTGLAENMEYIFTPAVIVVGIGGYLGAIFGTPDAAAPLWWLGAYVVFVGLNVAGVETSFRFTCAITAVALAILAVFFVAAAPQLDLGRFAFDIAPRAGASAWLPFGWSGVLAALPFAIWFYLGIEQLPLAAEEAHAPEKDMPKGLLLGLATLVLCAFATLVLNTGIAPGADALSRSDEPLLDGFSSLFGAAPGRLLALAAVAGLVASFHSIVFAYGRQIFSLSRAGYFPRWLSRVHPRRQTPHVALVVGALLGYAAALAIHLLGPEHPVGAVLLNLAVFGAVLSYVLQMAAFVSLRRRLPHVARPFVSPLGVPGAALAGAVAAATLVAMLAFDATYRKVVLGAALWYAAGLAWFALVGRRSLVDAPEERFAREARRES